ncbi:ankyrin repeat domain-containing protein [Flavobacterium enshiense]|uniref:ankyrin repeat domain-containing protein n=1 Tax=Flavobacterium enshiense TaxID=1341165 RepID=UPI00345D6979
MKKIAMFFGFLFMLQMAYSQQDIFEIARKGTVAELKNELKENPNRINSVNNEGYNLITLATYRQNNEVAAYLIQNGAEINGKSNYGSPLMAAVVKGNSEIAKMLIDAGADLNITDGSGNTALIYATIFKKYDIAEMLVKASADINFKDIRGKSAVDYAKMTNDEKLLQLFKKDKL